MVKKAEDLEHIYNEKMRGGEGTVEVIPCVNKGDCESKVRLIARLILNPGCSLGLHRHEGEEEVITVLKGTANYMDQGTEKSLKAGDVTICLNGQSHCIENSSDTEILELFAVINTL